jgi:hypothetical protein
MLTHIGTPQRIPVTTAPLGTSIVPLSQSNLNRDLLKSAGTLQDLGNDFRYVAPSFLIATFYEAIGTNTRTNGMDVSLMLPEEAYFQCSYSV